MATDAQAAAQEEREKDRDLSHAEIAQMSEDGDVELLRELVEAELHPGTVRVLDNYLSKGFILSNLKSEELEEFKWLLRIRVERAIEMVHPPRGGLTGDTRAIAYDDESANLPALSDMEKNIARAFADGIWFRARRSEGGFQQDKINESTNRIERTDRTQEDASAGLGGLF